MYKWRTNILYLQAIIIVLVVMLLPHITMAGFGVSPPRIMEDHLVRGAHIERTIYLVQGKPEADLTMEIVIDSPNIKDWISFRDGNIFTIPADVQQFPLVVTIAVPQDAPLDIYKAFIRLNTVPADNNSGENNQIAIAVGGRIDVNLTVGEGLFEEYNIQGIKILDIKSGENPKVTITIDNTGNVPISPQAASFELFNKFGNVRLGYTEISDFEKVPAFSKSNIELEFPIDVRLAEGEYWGNAKIYDDKNGVIRELRTVFQVKKGSALGLIAGAGSVGISTILSIIGVVVLIIIFFMVKRIFRRKKRRKHV